MATTANKSGYMSVKRSKRIFYISMMLLPMLQTLIFYFFVNFRSFTLGFTKYDMATNSYPFNGFNNFVEIFRDFSKDPYLRNSLLNSLQLFFLTLLFSALPSIVFSYYIYKKHTMSGFFKIILYTPHIISTVVFVLMYKYFLDNAIPEIANRLFDVEMEGLIGNVSNMGTVKTCVIVFQIWVSFGTKVLLYSGAMSGISDSIIESGKLDGITPMKELFFIVLPMIWPTFVTFMITSIVGLFTDQMGLYTFYGTGADKSLYTFGYYLYRNTKVATLTDYPYLSALGLMLTVVAVPVTLLTRKALEKYGPKTV